MFYHNLSRLVSPLSLRQAVDHDGGLYPSIHTLWLALRAKELLSAISREEARLRRANDCDTEAVIRLITIDRSFTNGALRS